MNELVCCNCDEGISGHMKLRELIHVAVQRGWNYLNGRFYCPECRQAWRDDLRCSV